MARLTIDLLRQVKGFIRSPYAWPGGYPQALILSDGAALCDDCARDNFRQICRSTLTGCNDGWHAAGCDVNWENTDLHCDHCGERIQSAYGETIEL